MLITEDLIKYNANAYGRDTGDCVIRAISLAFGKDYKKVASDLHKMRREWNYEYWNIAPNFEKVLDSYGIIKTEDFRNEVTMTEAEFAEKNSSGTYILSTGKDKDRKRSHLVCVIDGDIYDSWDSSNRYVKYVYVVKYGKDNINNIKMTSSRSSELRVYITHSFIEKFRNGLSTYEYGSMMKINSVLVYNNGYRYKISAFYYPRFNDAINEYFDVRDRIVNIGFEINLNPRLNSIQVIDDLIDNQVAHLKRIIPRRVKEILSNYEIATNNANSVNANPYFSMNDREIINQLPIWCRSFIVEVTDNSDIYNYSSDSVYKYEVIMNALKDDPQFDSDNQVGFYANSIKDLISQINRYKKNYSRPIY